MSRIAKIKSARDGVTLTLSNFVLEDSSSLSQSFLVTIHGYEVHAEARASSFHTENLGEYFSDIASNWTGWKGEKTWSTLEGEFELTATSDSTGHIKLAYRIRPSYSEFNWELSGALELEAGQLDSIAREIQCAWQASSAA